ncbi:MAG TPA: mannose-6-phosphate isomerase, class I, partial [Rhodoglobus sp.]|nr:mannose-6-phosphate isomerase, class I [Rhodoglobus sp.]
KGGPEAELWLGAHPGSPSRTENGTLLDVVPGRLPFLLKVLAAGSPLSLQAHPTMDQAQLGFERENAAGIPLDDPKRNYKDAFHKPELIYALSERFEALCGFRSAAEIRATLERLLERQGPSGPIEDWMSRLRSDDDLRPVFEWLITRGEGVDALLTALVAHADHATTALDTVADLAEAYPGDPGIAISLMLNRVTLQRGEVLYLPAGNIHAYLSGVGIELMASSDNVLRGGLTPKHVDVPELLDVLDFRPLPVPYLEPERPQPGVRVFRPDVPDFALVVAEGSADVPLTGPAIALCVEGGFAIAGEAGATTLDRGEAVFVSADEAELAIEGGGLLFVATTG